MAKCYASTIVNLALNEVGYLEKKTNENLYSKTGNAGYNNFNKYAADLDKIKGFYNGPKNGYAWCANFVDAMGVEAYGEADMKRITFHTIYGASCTQSAKQYKTQGRLYSSPKVGDEIFFKDSDGGCSHTGLVVAVDTLYVHTVEGNTSSASGVVANGGAVVKKKYLKTYNKIYGYGRPLYDKEPTTNKKVQAWQTAAARDGFEFKSGADGVWGKECEEVAKNKAAQVMVGSKNNDLIKFVQNEVGLTGDAATGKFGSKTKAAVIKYQKKKKLEADGIVGYNTYKALCGVK